MNAILFTLDPDPRLGKAISLSIRLEEGEIETRPFPDGETYVRLTSQVVGRDVVFLCTLDRPDAKTLPLLFAADAARQQGARSVGLVAPYLPYLRQDKAFKAGEAVTSRTFARLISGAFDWLVTIDPHLHRYRTLASIYTIPACSVTAAKPIAEWISCHVADPLLVGPDEESGQWVGTIAAILDAPSIVLTKIRSGDTDVAVTGSRTGSQARTPVVIDDIASSAGTLAETVRQLLAHGHPAPACVVVHPIFAPGADARLIEAGAGIVVSTNSISHATNGIDISEALAAAAHPFLATHSAENPNSIATTVTHKTPGKPA